LSGMASGVMTQLQDKYGYWCKWFWCHSTKTVAHCCIIICHKRSTISIFYLTCVAALLTNSFTWHRTKMEYIKSDLQTLCILDMPP
jgi:hypothetical protein